MWFKSRKYFSLFLIQAKRNENPCFMKGTLHFREWGFQGITFSMKWQLGKWVSWCLAHKWGSDHMSRSTCPPPTPFSHLRCKTRSWFQPALCSSRIWLWEALTNKPAKNESPLLPRRGGKERFSAHCPCRTKHSPTLDTSTKIPSRFRSSLNCPFSRRQVPQTNEKWLLGLRCPHVICAFPAAE